MKSCNRLSLFLVTVMSLNINSVNAYENEVEAILFPILPIKK